jgi:hypothetical protein
MKKRVAVRLIPLALLALVAMSTGLERVRAQQTPAPNMQDTIGFIREHIAFALDVTAHRRGVDTPDGYSTAFAERQGFTIRTISYDDSTKAIVLSGESWNVEKGGQEDDPGVPPRDPSPYTISLPLPSLDIDKIKLEHNPYYDDVNNGREKLPFEYESTPEWWITFDDGRERDYAGFVEVGLPVESQATGQRVLKALLHAIDLAGGRKAEPF